MSMPVSDVAGIIGVGLLLLAFGLNLGRKLSESNVSYLLMNMVGSGLAAWYAWAGNAVPFVVLELAWGGVAAIRLVGVLNKKGPA